ncbi:MAG: hypothetical protein ACLUTA_15955 [Blautia wexlerae]
MRPAAGSHFWEKTVSVLFDSIEDPSEMENHSNRPEFIEAEKNGFGEMVRYSDTLIQADFLLCSQIG